MSTNKYTFSLNSHTNMQEHAIAERYHMEMFCAYFIFFYQNPSINVEILGKNNYLRAY